MPTNAEREALEALDGTPLTSTEFRTQAPQAFPGDLVRKGWIRNGHRRGEHVYVLTDAGEAQLMIK